MTTDDTVHINLTIADAERLAHLAFIGAMEVTHDADELVRARHYLDLCIDQAKLNRSVNDYAELPTPRVMYLRVVRWLCAIAEYASPRTTLYDQALAAEEAGHFTLAAGLYTMYEEQRDAVEGLNLWREHAGIGYESDPLISIDNSSESRARIAERFGLNGPFDSGRIVRQFDPTDQDPT